MTETNDQDIATRSFQILAEAERLNSSYEQQADAYSNTLLQAVQVEVERINDNIDKERSTILSTLEEELETEKKRVEELRKIEQTSNDALRSVLTDSMNKLDYGVVDDFSFSINDFITADEIETVEEEDELNIQVLVNNFIDSFDEPAVLTVGERDKDEPLLITKAYEIYDQYTNESRVYMDNMTSRAKALATTALTEAYENKTDELRELADDTRELKQQLNNAKAFTAYYNNYLYSFYDQLLTIVGEVDEDDNDEDTDSLSLTVEEEPVEDTTVTETPADSFNKFLEHETFEVNDPVNEDTVENVFEVSDESADLLYDEATFESNKDELKDVEKMEEKGMFEIQ